MLVFPGPPRILPRRPLDVGEYAIPKSRRKAVPLGHERSRHTGIGWIDETGGRGRIDLGLFAQDERRNLIVFFRPVLHQLPAQAVIEREVRSGSPAILHEARCVLVAPVIGFGIRLIVVAANTD